MYTTETKSILAYLFARLDLGKGNRMYCRPECLSQDQRLALKNLDRSCEHKHVFHPAYHKPETCQNCFLFLAIDCNRNTNAESGD